MDYINDPFPCLWPKMTLFRKIFIELKQYIQKIGKCYERLVKTVPREIVKKIRPKDPLLNPQLTLRSRMTRYPVRHGMFVVSLTLYRHDAGLAAIDIDQRRSVSLVSLQSNSHLC